MTADVGTIIERIEGVVYARRIRAKDFFRDYDKLRSGRVTKPQFCRVIATMGIKLSQEESEALADHFTEDGPHIQPPQIVNFMAFCACIDECFGVLTGLESDPGAKVPRPGATVPAAFTPQPVDDEERLDHILHRLALMCKARGVVLKYCYQDFERSDATSLVVPRRGGKVTIDQFKRSFPFVKDFEREEIELIVDHYLTDNGLVHFGKLHEDIAEHLNTDPPTFPTSELIKREDPAEWSQQLLGVVEKIQARVVERRVRLMEHFQDFDPLRKGFCYPNQVKTIFSVLKIPIDEKDFEELVSSYTREDGQFCYAAFCAEVDQAFTTNGLEKQPLTRIAMPDASTTIASRRNRMALGPPQIEAIIRLEEAIRARVHTRRVLIRPAFEHFDPSHRGHISKGQFLRVMDSLGFQLDEYALDLLCYAYCDLGNHTDFNYIDFCHSCDPPNEDEREAMSEETGPYKPKIPSQYFDARGRIQPRSPVPCH
jgi:Ca2+-binding EF-hand superfamily protein